MKMTLNETRSSTFFTTGGIFSEINSLNVFTWLTSNNKLSLDYEYYLKRSGYKTISPLFTQLKINNTTTYLNDLARVIINLYRDKWNKLYDLILVNDYNPLNNKNITTTKANTKNNINTPDITITDDTGTATKTTVATTDSTNNSTYGFNDTAGAVPSDKSENTNNVITSGNANENTVHNTNIKTGTETDASSENETISVLGYDANKIQDNIESEITLRNKYNFYDIVMGDIDTILVTNVYE